VANGETPAEPSRRRAQSNGRFWLWAALIVVAVAILGIVIGSSLGNRQAGLLAGSGANGRPAIVVPTPATAVAAAAAVSPLPSPSAVPSSVVAGGAGTPAPAQGATEYVVQPGDTLRSIALEQYGDAEQWQRIYDANRAAIGPNPDALVVGSKLELPAPQSQ